MNDIKNNKTIKVGIADDNKIFILGMKVALSPFKDIQFIIEADNGVSLLDQLKNKQPDVILLDLGMPVMDGMTALPQIKLLYPHVKVIILSMDMNISTISKLIGMRANSYLIKKADPEFIYTAIKACYEHGFYSYDLIEMAHLLDYTDKKE